MYSASLSKCSLKAPQCRLLAAVLLNNPTEAQWKAQIVEENLLQMRAPGASLTIAAYLRQRLKTVSREVLVLVRDGETPLSTQATFAAALKHSALLRDFMDLQVREELRLFHPALSARSWDEFFAGCTVRDPAIEKWSAPVVAKLGQNTFRMLVEVGILVSTQTKQLQKISLYPELVAVLERDGEEALLRALRVNAV